ncbi:MAG TPA: DUF1684 domain-containing protein [Thermoflexales bacterium]|nr:DUF1684 domain-containing protein [Thermoflexales bacterium]HQW36047.1 DUF1684 domain-containing protein [Thermoflexales bacterium]HQZ21162.1 DUF1684 domain-containing protein [Thermoflexales bacterium]HQZ98849.1 DUF1684 domain-containing protein [Thermoflexales bacterium]
MQNTPFIQETQSWREQRETNLKKPDGWLAVSGLFWLKDGANSIGGDPACDVPLPAGSAPAQVGVIHFHDGVASLSVNAGVSVTADDKPITSAILRSDADGAPTSVKLNDLVFVVLKRGQRYGVRLWDANSEERKHFHGLKWYEPKEEYRVMARFIPYAAPRKLLIDTVLEGFQEESLSPGVAEFELGGKTHRLVADSGTAEQGLFINFRDLTSAKTTYGAGRFLQTAGVKNGEVVLDFNRAFTPPCGFTNFATCPIPLRENWLDIAVEAGELNPH